jgi:hypothetical protein
MASNPPIPIEDLQVGHQYRIEHRKGLLPPKIGIFVRIVSNNAIFNHLSAPDKTYGSPNITSAFRDDEWTFHKSGKSIALGKLSNSKSLPPNLEKYLGRLGGRMRMKKTKRTRRTRRTRRTQRR